MFRVPLTITEFVTIAGVVVAVLTLFFGDNIYQQITGRSFYSSHDISKDIITTMPPMSSTAQATSSTSLSPTATLVRISSLNRLAILTLFKIPRKTKTDVDRLDTIFRPNRSNSLVVIPNYPLLSKYELDEYGYILENGQPIDIPLGTDMGKYLDIDWGQWRKYLGVFDFIIPANTIQFCGFYIRSEVGGGNWESSQRFIYSADIGADDFKIERASWVEIKDCSDSPITDWSQKQAENAWAPTDLVYYWDKESNSWIRLK
uniref:Uncharacterized protein n=2 Tax=Litorilinea aerophila TaxID=1204385 RepID=A0A540V895_9CHLR